MRYFILFKILLITTLSFSQTATIKGKIDNAEEQAIRFIYTNDIITSQPKHEMLVSDLKDGEFSATISAEAPSLIYFSHGSKVAQLYVKPNDNLELTFNAKDFFNTLNVKQDNGKENQVLTELASSFSEKTMDVYSVQQTLYLKDSMSLEEFASKERQLVKEQLEFIQKRGKKLKLSDDFINTLKAEVNYGSINNLYQIGMKKRVQPNDKAFSFMEEVSLTDTKSLKSFNYHLAVKFYFQHDFYNQKEGNNIEVDKWFLNNMYDKGSEKLSGEIKEIFIASTAYTVISNKWDFLIDSIAPKYFKDAKNQTYVTQIKPMYDEYITEKNKPLPDGANKVEGEYNNIEELLEKYKGKVVYIDVWASWCGPCKREMPFSIQLQEQFKGEDVVFLFVAVNDKPENWKAAIKQLSITGEHYFGDQNFSASFMKKFEIRGIPRYLIADKTGAIVNTNAPRPSHEGIAETLKELLK